MDLAIFKIGVKFIQLSPFPNVSIFQGNFKAFLNKLIVLGFSWEVLLKYSQFVMKLAQIFPLYIIFMPKITSFFAFFKHLEPLLCLVLSLHQF